MNVYGHYQNLSVSELEKIRTEILSALEKARKGVQFVEVDMGGNKGKKQLLSYNELIHELKEVQYALKKVLPDVYGRATKRIIPNFNKALIRMKVVPNIGIENYIAEQEYIEAGAIGYDPVEGHLATERLTTPDMTRLGEQFISYRAINSKGESIVGVRKIIVHGDLYVDGLAEIYGFIVNDDNFNYARRWSSITNTMGYFYDKDYQNQIAKDNIGNWSIYDYAGLKHDSQATNSKTPLSIHGAWNTVKVTNEFVK